MISNVSTRLISALNAFFVFDLIDDAIADLLCLQTHYHGTSPKAYHSIMNHGADPGYGAKGGETKFHEALSISSPQDPNDNSGFNCSNRFFVCLDSGNAIFKRLIPRVYTAVACIGENCDPEKNCLQKAFLIFISIIEGSFSPTLKFRFNQKEEISFEEDTTGYPQNYVGFTKQNIPTHHIGLIGSITHGLNSEWSTRVKANPLKFAIGLVKLIIAAALIGAAVFATINVPYFALGLGAYTLFCGLQAIARFVVPLLTKSQANSTITKSSSQTSLIPETKASKATKPHTETSKIPERPCTEIDPPAGVVLVF